MPTSVNEPLDAPDPETQQILAWTRYTYADQELVRGGVTYTYRKAVTVEEQATGGDAGSPVWARTEYSEFALTGEPGLTREVGVGYEAPSDLTPDRPASGDESYADTYTLDTVRTYDAFGNLLTESRPGQDGDQVQAADNTYDVGGRLLRAKGVAVSGVGQVEQVSAYDILDRVTETYQRDALDSTSQERMGWSTTTYDTTSNGPRVVVRSKDGKPGDTYGAEVVRTTTVCDALGFQLTSSDTTVGGLAARSSYDMAGNVIRAWPEDVQDESGANLSTYPLLHATRSVYDVDGRVTKVTEPSTDCFTLNEYDSEGWLSKSTEPDGSWSEYTYDLAGNETSVKSSGDLWSEANAPYDITIARTVYDVQGRVIRALDSGNGETDYAYDRLGRETMSLRPASAQSATPGGDAMVTYTTYNSLGWAMHEFPGDVDDNGVPDDVETKWTYNPDGSVSRMEVGKGSKFQTTTYTYDDAGRVTRKTTVTGASDSSYVAYAYDAFGRLTTEEQHKVASGVDTPLRRTTLSYDGIGRVLEKDVEVLDLDTGALETAIQEESSYSNNDPALDNASVTVQRTLTMAPAGGSDPGPLSQTIVTDGRGREVSNTASFKNSPTADPWSLSRAVSGRDEADRVTAVSTSRTSGEATSGGTGSQWGFNEYGRLASQGGLGFSSAGAFTYGKKSGRRLEAHLHPRVGDDLEEKYRYYDDGRVKKAGSFDVAKDGTYTYNAHGDMKTATLGSATRIFHYQGKHRLDWTRVDEGDRTYYQWDADGLGQRTGQGVGTQNPDTGVWSPPATYKTTYAYDAAGRMTGFNDATDSSHKDKATYSYDAEGRRIRTVLVEDYNLPAADRTVTTSDYLYDGIRLLSLVITQTDGNGALQSKWQLAYLHDAAGRPFAGLARRLTDGATHTFYLVTTDRGDVVQLADGAHKVFASYRYDAYGRPLDSSTRATNTTEIGGLLSPGWAERIAAENVLRYASYCYDAHSGLYYLMARYYDPITRQFMSRDPLKADADESPYQYCGGAPVLLTDPDGTKPLVDPGYTAVKKGKKWVIKLTDPAKAAANAAYWASWSSGSSGAGKTPSPSAQLPPRIVTYRTPDPNSLGARIGRALIKLLDPNWQAEKTHAASDWVMWGGGIEGSYYDYHRKTHVTNPDQALMFDLMGAVGTAALLGEASAASRMAATSRVASRSSVVEVQAVIGRQAHAARFEGNLNYEVLNVPKNVWTPQLNDAWVDSIVARRMNVRVASDVSDWNNLWNPIRNEPTILAREVIQLEAAGYQWDGMILRSP